MATLSDLAALGYQTTSAEDGSASVRGLGIATMLPADPTERQAAIDALAAAATTPPPIPPPAIPAASAAVLTALEALPSTATVPDVVTAVVTALQAAGA